ncbi:MAG: hypothetical protein M1142_06815 [Patescibacteria group bacterium]|nr:hypothetical protein [Patescibacteria group bacterium]
MIDPLKYLQFPWRFLMVIIFFISMVVGSIFQLLNGRKYQALIIGLVLLVVASNFFYFRPEKFRYINDQDLLTGKNWENELGRSIYDFLPIYAKAPPVAPATSRYEIVSGDAEVTDFQEKDTQIHFKVFVNDLARVELSQYYFPLWKVFVDGKNVDINYQNNLGLITFTIDPGMHKVEAVLYDTPIRQIGNLVTLISSILFIFLGVWQLKRVRLFILAVINGFAK